MKIRVNSEIGKLKKVFVHRPGKEVERLYPEIFERLLFDDIMDLPIAQKEHDEFAGKLKAEGIQVYYIEKLAAEALDTKNGLREKFVHDFIEQAGVTAIPIIDSITKFLLSHKSSLDLVNAAIAGVKKTEIKVNTENDLDAKITAHDSYPFYLDPIPNILFARDPIINIYEDIKVNTMCRTTRKRERIFFDYILEYHPEWKENKSVVDKLAPGTMEGGDVLVFSKETLFIGLSERTTAKAIESLASVVFPKYKSLKTIVALEIPKSHATMHLDTVLTQMDYDKFSIDPDMYNLDYNAFEITYNGSNLKITEFYGKIEQLIKKYVHPSPKFFQVGNGDPARAKREQWNDGANCLCIAPGKIVVYSRNYTTNELVSKNGIQTIQISGSELSRGRGGPRCMTMPIEREEI